MNDERLPYRLLQGEFAKRSRGGTNVSLMKWISLASNEATCAQVLENGAKSAMHKWIKPKTPKRSSEREEEGY